MAWDTERTKRLLLDAAAAEFCERGLAGARVDRIAAAAGVNKERIYKYFGPKDQLFATVISREIGALGEAVHLEGEGPAAVVDYAERFFDHLCAQPALARLLFWEGLELGVPVAEAVRREGMLGKIRDIRRAVPQLSQSRARELLLTILSLCYSWQALPTLDRLAAGAAAEGPERQRVRRAAIGRAIAADLAAELAVSNP
ncbi:TetR/AcrR family transcriptional regulator [Nocardia veterana]|uniref:TetR/AcrR family transcriptional regulator n=1 Tax=Nocardia veterana TaxID=132249 RepID=A0A7X6LT43_9NOCA|nr:TetR/AcrR family transcriptional regulator [Nocardia veterana]NKY84058.1 TetR/AcrR family transcriptional regulator [Nocardia veterana]